MSSFFDDVDDPFLSNWGLQENSIQKFLFFSVIPYAIIYAFKPVVFFDQNGNLRPWDMLSKKTEATPVPLYLFAGFIGLASFLFI